MLYTKLVDLYVQLERTSKRLEKTFLLAQFFQSCPKEDLRDIVYLIQGKVFPAWDERKLGMSSKLLAKVIAVSVGVSSDKVEQAWKKEGDLGLVAEKLLQQKKQQTLVQKKLYVQKVVDNISKLATLEGDGTVNRKIGLIAELIGSASPVEARFVIRTVNETLRTGVGEGVIRDALVWTFYPKIAGIFYRCEKCKTINPQRKICLACHSPIDAVFAKEKEKSLGKEAIVPTNEKEGRALYDSYLDEVQHAFDVGTDFGALAEQLKEHGPKILAKKSLTIGRPIKVMLYTKVKDIKEGFEVVGKPALIEPKIDGFRMQIHKSKENVKLFTRRLEDVTKQFPDVMKVAKSHIHSKDAILDSEVVGIDPETKRVVPFQKISQRIKRKYDIEQMEKTLPVVIMVFDVIHLNGESMLDVPFEERRKKLKAILKSEKHKIELIEQFVTSDEKKAEEYYQECLMKGHEGVMMKNAQGVYQPGKRVGFGVKIKPVMESLDLVIVGADWGEGKRARWLSSFTVACRDKDALKEMGKVGTGIKEKSEEGVSYEELTTALKKLVIEEKGRSVKVKPKIVLEVVYQNIQKSPTYSSGYALRFPRVHRLRLDKGVSDINTLKDVERFYREQKS